MPDDATFLRIKRAAHDTLFRIPGVRAVAMGHKLVAGRNSGVLAIVVLVDHKQPLEALSSDEIIPTEIQGVPTDVQEWVAPVEIGALVNDKSKDRPLLGGSSIVVEFEDQDPNNPILLATKHTGTVGFLAQTNGKVAGIPAGGIVGVTAAHIVIGPSDKVDPSSWKIPTGHKVGQPTTTECSSCSFCCNDIIGKVLYGNYGGVKLGTGPVVDMAIIALTKGLDYYADIKGGIGAVNQTRTLTSSDLNTTKVRKYGQTTGLTTGTVTLLDTTVNQASQSFTDGWITITPDPTTKVWDCCLCTNGGGGGTAENFPSFACVGDSGAAVIDDQNNIVGLLVHASSLGQGFATGIDVVTTTLGITVLHAASAGQKQTVPGVAGVNMMVGAAAETAPLPLRVSGTMEQSLRRAHEEIVATALGRDCAAAVERHHVEALDLVNSNRRVAVVWHRNNGPQIIANLLRMIHVRNERPPTEIDGRPLTECLLRIQQAFERYGSPALRAALAQWAPRLKQFLGLSFNELLAALDGRDAG